MIVPWYIGTRNRASLRLVSGCADTAGAQETMCGLSHMGVRGITYDKAEIVDDNAH
jgi:hypothetical protein